MLLGALIDLGVPQKILDEVLARAEIAGLSLDVTQVGDAADGGRGLRVRSLLGALAIGDVDADPASHPHYHVSDVLKTLDKMKLGPVARRHAEGIYDILIDAETTVHKADRDYVHLHEVGALDSILDVVGIAVALEYLGDVPWVLAPIPSGVGTVDTSHGVLQCPVPAAAHIIKRFDLPLQTEPALKGETLTPTGAAVLAYCCKSFAAQKPQHADKVGVGVGNRVHADRPNVVRLHGVQR